MYVSVFPSFKKREEDTVIHRGNGNLAELNMDDYIFCNIILQKTLALRLYFSEFEVSLFRNKLIVRFPQYQKTERIHVFSI